MEIIETYGFILMGLAIVFGLYMTWGIGANDVANAMGTSVGSGAITVKQAILIAAIFEFAGAFIAGGNVTKTIRKGIVDPSSIVNNPEVLVFGMLAAAVVEHVGEEPDVRPRPGEPIQMAARQEGRHARALLPHPLDPPGQRRRLREVPRDRATRRRERRDVGSHRRGEGADHRGRR